MFDGCLIETPRLDLRHFVEEDLDALAALMENADLPSQLALIFRPENRLIGYCGFFRQVVDDVNEIEIGYRLHPDYWNRGLATEAARAVRDYAFKVLKLERVISLIHPDNHASRRVTEKNGMKLEKTTVFRGFSAQVFSCNREGS